MARGDNNDRGGRGARILSMLLGVFGILAMLAFLGVIVFLPQGSQWYYQGIALTAMASIAALILQATIK